MSSNISSLSTPWDSEETWKQTREEKPFTPEETDAACEELIDNTFVKKFPVREKFFSDPVIHGQHIGLFSFIPAKGATPDKKGVFGFAKIRGNFASEEEATEKARQIVNDYDSTNIIFHALVGKPFPITLDRKYAADHDFVNMEKDTDEAVTNAIRNKKKDEEKRSRELRDRADELYKDVSPDKPIEQIEEEEYITLRVKKAQLTWTYLEYFNKLKQIRELILKSREDIDNLNDKRPELQSQYYNKYMESRKKAGINEDEQSLKNSFLQYLVEDISIPGLDSHREQIDQVFNIFPEQKDYEPTLVKRD